MTLFSLLYQGDVHPATEEKVIPAEAFSKLIEASEIIEKAKVDAEMLLQKTKEECEELKKSATEEGLQKGLETYNEEIMRLSDSIKKLRVDLQSMVLPVALKAAKKIVRKQLDLFPETIVEIVLETIKPISESQQVTIYVHKDDKEILDRQKPRLKEILEQVELLTIQERDDIEKGGCIVKTESGMINASSENQWRALERAFERYHRG